MNVDLLIENARILTQDPRVPVVARLAITQGRVLALGDDCEGLRSARRVDLAGSVVLPGFNDAHAHSVWFGHTLLEVSLAACNGLDDVYGRIERATAAKEPVSTERASNEAAEWIVASGYNQMDTDGEYPDAAALDRAAGGRPVWIKHTSGHSCIVNQAAMSLLGITGREKIDGGLVVVDSGGAPTGRLEETAMSLVQNYMLPASQDQIVAALDAATRAYAAEGLTSVTDAGIGGGWIGHSAQEFAAYQRALELGLLRTRMQPMLVGDVLEEVRLSSDGRKFRGLPGGLRSGLGDARLQLGPVKMFLDGSILGNTARVSEGYCNHPENHGYFQGDVDEMRPQALDTARAGWALAMHAVGDEAIDLAIGILRELQAEGVVPPLPHRIEHGGIVTSEQIEALAELGTSIVAQPHFMTVFGDGFWDYIGEARSLASFPLGSLLRHGLPVAGSSDRPVAPGRPLDVMQSAVERLTASGRIYGPDERLTAEQAVRAYTVGSAEVTGWAHEKGQLTPGFLADFVVLSDDPTRVETSSINSIDVLATAVGGVATFDPDGRLGEVTT